MMQKTRRLISGTALAVAVVVSIVVSAMQLQLALHSEDHPRDTHPAISWTPLNKSRILQRPGKQQHAAVAAITLPTRNAAPALSDIKTPQQRASAIQQAMAHAWRGYTVYTWGADELRPVSKSGKYGVDGAAHSGFHGLAASLVDAMSTLHLMGMHQEFEQCTDWIAANMSFDAADLKHKFNVTSMPVSFFEVTIRIVGGLISAFDLSGDKLLLNKAADLMNRMMPVFESESGNGILTNDAQLPWTTPMMKTPPELTETLAEVGSNLLELGALSQRTGNPTYKLNAEKGIKFVHSVNKDNHLLGMRINRTSGQVVDSYMSVGAAVDSYFEYLLKYWLLGGKKDDYWRVRWVESVDSAIAQLALRPVDANVTLIGAYKPVIMQHYWHLSHLACYWPGSVALGVVQGAFDAEDQQKQQHQQQQQQDATTNTPTTDTTATANKKKKRYMQIANDMMHACFQLYNSTPTGLAPEDALVDPVSGAVQVLQGPYLQRPEFVESLFYLWRATGDQKYRDWGWQIFTTIETRCKTDAGYSGLVDATAAVSDVKLNDRWVLNTEAHPLRVSDTTGAAE